MKISGRREIIDWMIESMNGFSFPSKEDAGKEDYEYGWETMFAGWALTEISDGSIPSSLPEIQLPFAVTATPDGMQLEMETPEDRWHEISPMGPPSMSEHRYRDDTWLHAAIYLLWDDRDLRKRLRRCSNCSKFYFQRSVKRNPKGRYFCSSVDTSSKCKQEWHDGQKNPDRTRRTNPPN